MIICIAKLPNKSAIFENIQNNLNYQNNVRNKLVGKQERTFEHTPGLNTPGNLVNSVFYTPDAAKTFQKLLFNWSNLVHSQFNNNKKVLPFPILILCDDCD